MSSHHPQGPFVHIASICAAVLSRFMSIFSGVYEVSWAPDQSRLHYPQPPHLFTDHSQHADLNEECSVFVITYGVADIFVVITGFPLFFSLFFKIWKTEKVQVFLDMYNYLILNLVPFISTSLRTLLCFLNVIIAPW